MKTSVEIFDIAIVGFGPTGATLAHLLGASGLNVLVLEREGGPYQLPRAVHFDDEVMRVFQTIGIGEEIAADTLVNPGMRFVDADNHLILDWSRPQEIGRHGWHASYRFHQPTLEAVLQDTIKRYANVVLRRRCDAFMLDDRDDHVEVRYEDTSCGKIHVARAAHVVGCDGARSLVRRFIAPDVEDHGFHEKWLVVDALLKVPRPDLGDHSIQYCHSKRSITYTRQPGERRRWELRLPPGDEGSPITQADQVWPLLQRWITPDDAQIERIASYTFHSVIAQRWRLGRLWIAGDAAHQSPPFMGQGMCAGIRDAANLAWKLALAVRGEANDQVLESYDSERIPNVRNYITTAVRLGGLINSTNPEAALQMAHPSTNGVSRMESLTSTLGPGLGSGPQRGQIFGQPRLSDGRLMDDLIGYAPALIIESALLRDLATRPRFAVIASDQAPGVSHELSKLGARAALLRPDRYVMATANTLEQTYAMLSASHLGGLFSLANHDQTPQGQARMEKIR